MRDRLIELLRTPIAVTNGVSTVGEIKVSLFEAEFLADHLLANGVIVLPCKVGDMVYVIEPCVCYNNYSEFEHCHHRRTKATKWIEMVRVPTQKHHTKCLKLFERPFKYEHLNKLGKSVFLTKEEAEQALKGGEG